MITTTAIDNNNELPQTRTQWLQNRANAGQHFDKLVVGAAMFRRSNTADEFELLVIRRAATEDYYPNCFEIPSGKVDDGETIGEALAREQREETGLTLNGVLAQLPEIIYETEKTIMKGGKEVHIVKKACQLNFAIEASSEPIKLNEVEHSEWKWVAVDDLETLQMTELMCGCTENALKWAKKHLDFATKPTTSAWHGR